MAPVGLVLSVQLKQLLFTALADGSTYSALVPWVLDSEHKGLTLLQHAQERQCLQHVQLQAGHARPQDMQQCVLQVVAEACQHALALPNVACTQTPGQCADTEPLAALQPARRINSKQQQARAPAGSKASRPSSAGSTCSLSQPASRLAKLHGHLLSHLAAPDLAQQLQQLLMMLTAGPLDIDSNSTPGGPRSSQTTSSKQGTSKLANRSSPQGSITAEADQPVSANAPAATQAPTAVGSPQQLLPCCTCAARYAAKALECCSKLLACMPVELQQALACSVHLQLYSPSLTSLLTKNLAAGPGAGGAAASASLPSAATPWQQQHGQAAGADCTPASGGGGASAGRPGVLGWAAAGTPGSAGSGGGAAWLTDTHRSLPGSSKGGARHSSRTPASARLSGLGLLMPNTPGSGLPSRPASAGQLPAGGKAAKTAAVCNREKSRDLFFTILRRASSKLDSLRQAQNSAEAAAAGCPQQAVAAKAAAAADMAELLAEVGVSAKQLLLQLAPSNLGYLAELFMACVLQAASTGEPLLEPALVIIAEKDPSRFQKLQQRLADRPAGAAASAASPGAAGTPGSNSSSRQAPRTGPGSAKQQHSAKQASQAQGGGQQKASGEPSGSSLSAGQADGLVHVMHARTRNRPAKHPQQQPHILAATAGTAALQQAMTAAHNANSGKAANKRLIPQRHIVPQANNSLSQQQQQQQQQQGSTGLQLGSTGTINSNGIASSPVPLAAAGAADSPLAASCLSPLFAAASESPLTSIAAPGAARVAVGSPLISSSSGTAQVRPAPAASVLGGRAPEHSSQPASTQPHAASLNSSSAITPAARILPGVSGGTAGPLQKPGAATALGKSGKPAAGTGLGGSGPHSAPPKLQAALNGSALGPGAGAVLAQHGSGPAQFMLQLLELMPVSQHVLVVLLHAADSSSFNRALLGVVSSRVEKLLSSSPGSFTAASGLGQQAAAIAALGSYCSYLAFAAGASEPEGPAAVPSDSGVLLQQQPLLDIAAMLQRLLAGSMPGGGSSRTTELQQAAGCSELDTAWRLALALPFAVSCMRLAGLNLSAAASPCMQAALSTLHTLRRIPALSPTTPGFGALPVCVGCCIQSCHLSTGQTAAPAVGPSEIFSSRLDELSRVVASGSCLVDSSYWSICCPGLQQLLAVLAAAAVAVSPVGPSAGGPVSLSASALRAQQQRQQDKTAARACEQQQASAGSQTPAAPGADNSAASRKASATDTGEATPRTAAAAAAGGAKSQSSTSSSPAAGAAAARHTTPLLLAPRGPPEVPSPPAVMLDALAAVSDPVRQQLQQAFISQYSTDDNPVKMRDVLTVINGILFANSLSTALGQGLPGVLQKHLDLLQQAVQQQLTPTAAQAAAAGANTQLLGQDLARAVHVLYSQQLCVALPEALEAAMQAAADHACQAAAAACGALLPADVPPAAATTAAAMVTASCKASCAQRLLHEVPVLVQSTLADAADDLVRLVNRQWAVHTRMTVGAAGAAAGTGAVTRTDSSSSIKTSGSGSTEGRQRARLQPVKLEAAAAPPAGSGCAAEASGPAALPAAATQEAAVQEDVSDIDRTTQQSSSARRVVAAPADGKAAKGCAPFGGAVGSCSETVAATAQPAPNGTVPPVMKVAEAAGSSPSRSVADGSTEGFDPIGGAPADATAAPLPAAAAGADPSSPAGILAAFLAAHAPIQSYEQGMPEQQALVCRFTAAAEAAAQQLVAGATDGQFSMGEVEQLLIQALQQAQAATQAAQVSVTGGSSACAATGAQSSIPRQVFAHQRQEHLLLLLAGALMHALMCCPTVKAAVWAGGLEAGTAEVEAATAVGLPHLTQLPVLLMKAARGDMPVWLLRQLRQRMQQATLGCH